MVGEARSGLAAWGGSRRTRRARRADDPHPVTQRIPRRHCLERRQPGNRRVGVDVACCAGRSSHRAADHTEEDRGTGRGEAERAGDANSGSTG
ncbi:unnamed protein product [Mycetohabitans rhizoxinica HKI 454]|uniref:Uncharacterized protein n=1 Tax=Mycetohabitans rhizoxinica (strain DSM 19002 / CIP 109453 / HKI 454) TaxID=882378 RepID=E5ASW9_MYCRK|nr:unnamed protein product [Mycetohabitans rhizoxinica HKI 454]